MKKINVVGLGPGNIELLTLEARNCIIQSQILVGGIRQIEAIRPISFNKEEYIVEKFSDMLMYLKENINKDISIIVSGDSGFYSLTDYLVKNIENERLNIIPGISSFQYLFSKLKKCWHDYLITSIHGRENDYIALFKNSKKGIILLTDKENTPQKIAKNLIENELEEIKIIVGENLSYKNEKIYYFKAKEYLKYEIFSMNIVVLEKGE